MTWACSSQMPHGKAESFVDSIGHNQWSLEGGFAAFRENSGVVAMLSGFVKLEMKSRIESQVSTELISQDLQSGRGARASRRAGEVQASPGSEVQPAGFQAVGSVQALASVGMPRNAASLVTFAALIVWSSCAGLVVGGSSHGLHLPAIREECAGTHVLRLQGGEGCIGAAGRNCGNIRAELQGLISSVPLPSVSGWIPGQARELVAAHLQVAGEKLHKVGVRVGKILEKCYVESHYLRHRLGRRLASYVRGIRERLENYVDSANCVFAAPPPRTHIKTQFQRLLLRIPCFSGSALARAESVGCMRGGGDATKVTAQLQGFLEAITSTADSVIKGVPGVIDGIKQLPKLRQLGAFKPGGAWHGQKRYVDLPSVVQVTWPAWPALLKMRSGLDAAYVAPPPMSCEQSPEHEAVGDRDKSPPTTSSPQTSRSTSRVLAQGSMSPSLDLRGGDNGESGGVEVQAKSNIPEPGEGHQETGHSVDDKKLDDSDFAAATAQAMDSPSPVSPPATDGSQPGSSEGNRRQNMREGAKAGETEIGAAEGATSGGSLGGKPSHLLKTTSEDIMSLMSTLESRLQLLSQWKVIFVTCAKVSYGDAIFVSGDSDTLGNWDPARAVQMKHDNGSWSARVDQIPDGTRYRYLVQKHDPAARGESRWLTSYPLELSPCMEHCALNEGYLVEDDTSVDVRFKVHVEAKQVWVAGSCKAMGGWDEGKALKLTKRGKTGWEGIVSIPSDDLMDFEYKFFCVKEDGGSPVYERGANRGSDAALVEPQKDDMRGLKKVINLECVWEGLLVRFMIFHPLDKPELVMAASGGHPAMGGWLGEPLRMGLGNERTLLTGVKGMCWEVTFPAGDDDFDDMQYRYCIIDSKTKTAIFEREPNRRVAKICGRLSGARIAEPTLGIGRPFSPSENNPFKGIRQREWQCFDGNFVPPNLSFNHVPPHLAIGPYPQTQEDVDLMKKEGITGVLNVQTDDDHKRRMIDWALMEKMYGEAGIDVIRVPIEDFHGGELERLVNEGAKAVDRMVNIARERGEQPKVYIHCTAGMGRAPAVACIWMVWREGYTLADALAHVKKHRTVAAPNWHAMEAALKHVQW